MKLWDLRTRSKARHTFDGKAESVRDVQFNPASIYEFAAVFDNGSLQTWDMRNPSQFERKWSAHNGLALTVDWDPNGSFIATGGRDKAIKIWDSKSERRKPIHQIQTIASVARVTWRPGYESQIASSALSNDNRIHIWDFNRPYIPFLTLDEHENSVNGLLWNDAYSLWSCSKDESFVQHNVLNGYNPSTLLNSNTAYWNAYGDIAYTVCDKRSSPSRNQKRVFSVWDSREQDKWTPQKTGFASTGSFDASSFAAMSHLYSCDYGSISETCDHNYSVTLHLTRYH